uniref:PPM-type phosphatase domain-containing protein n=1 Tax=Macrostomum lignano TaxID=282301 RepID=A0A1I8FRB3_9PLAT
VTFSNIGSRDRLLAAAAVRPGDASADARRTTVPGAIVESHAALAVVSQVEASTDDSGDLRDSTPAPVRSAACSYNRTSAIRIDVWMMEEELDGECGGGG